MTNNLMGIITGGEPTSMLSRLNDGKTPVM